MNKNYKQISEELEHLVKNILGVKYLINSYFRISKTTPEQTRVYHTLITEHSILYHIFYSASLSIINIIKVSMYFILSLIMFYQYYFISRSSKKIDHIFLTHAIRSNIDSTTADQYFGLMPHFLRSQKYNVAMFYINHNKFGYRKNYNKLKKKNGGMEIYLSPKFMLPYENLEFLLQTVLCALKCLKIAVNSIKQEPNQAKILIASIPYFFSRSTYNNYLLKKRCLAIQKRTKPKYFIFTFEGHSYEQYVFDALNESKSDCYGVFYQHSPIVPGHLGLIHFLQGLNSKIEIMVTGPVYKKYFANFSNFPTITVVGSQKSAKKVVKPFTNNSDNLLFAPEGTAQSTLEFIHLIRELIASNLPNRITLRLHPDLPNSLKIRYYLYKLKKNSNFNVSNSELNADLEKSMYIFFRSSAVSVEALLSGAQLVFYTRFNELNTNPLSLIQNLSLQASNAVEVLNILERDHDSINTEVRLEAFNQFFAKLNYPLLLKLA